MGLHREDSPVVGETLHVGHGGAPVSLLGRLSVSETDVVVHFSNTLGGTDGWNKLPTHNGEACTDNIFPLTQTLATVSLSEMCVE